MHANIHYFFRIRKIISIKAVVLELIDNHKKSEEPRLVHLAFFAFLIYGSKRIISFSSVPDVLSVNVPVLSAKLPA